MIITIIPEVLVVPPLQEQAPSQQQERQEVLAQEQEVQPQSPP